MLDPNARGRLAPRRDRGYSVPIQETLAGVQVHRAAIFLRLIHMEQTYPARHPVRNGMAARSPSQATVASIRVISGMLGRPRTCAPGSTHHLWSGRAAGYALL